MLGCSFRSCHPATWVPDEHGPFHVTASGRAIQRLSPADGTLPREPVNRVPDRGMEGVTLSPDRWASSPCEDPALLCVCRAELRLDMAAIQTWAGRPR
jgi:hypothetical protein